jgi:putative inorganic carbon (HCO3(-)) transporter
VRDIVVTAIVLGALLLVFKHPHYGIWLWGWLSYMNPHMQAWGFAQSMPFAMMTAVVTVTAYMFSKEPKRMPWSAEIVLLVIFLSWVTFTTFFAFFSELAWEQWNKVWRIQLMTLVTAMLLTNRERLHGFVWIIALSLGYYGIKGGIFTIVHGGAFRVQGPIRTFIEGNNEMALALIMTVPLIRYLHLQEKRHWLKLGLAGAMVLTGVAAIGSQSRGALLAGAMMALFLWLKSRSKFVTGIFLAGAVGIIGAVMPQEWYDRMSTVKTYDEDASALGRINAWHTAFNVAKQRITGGGFEMFRPSTFAAYAPEPGRVHDVHSVYFEVMGEHGFIGLGIWLLLAVVAWHTGSRVIRACKNDPERKWAADLAAMTQVSMIGYGAAGAFLGLAYFDYYYHLIVILVLTHKIAIDNFWGTNPTAAPIGPNSPRLGKPVLGRRLLR